MVYNNEILNCLYAIGLFSGQPPSKIYPETSTDFHLNELLIIAGPQSFLVHGPGDTFCI